MLYLFLLPDNNVHANIPQYYVKRTLPACLVMISNVERLFSDCELRKKTAMIRSDLLFPSLVAALALSGSIQQRATWTAQTNSARIGLHFILCDTRRWHTGQPAQLFAVAVLQHAGRVTKRRSTRTQFRCCSNHHYLVTVIQFPRTYEIQRRLLNCHHFLRVGQLTPWLPAYDTQDWRGVDAFTYPTSSQQGQRCRFRDLLLAGRSGVRIPAEEHSEQVQGPTQPPY